MYSDRSRKRSIKDRLGADVQNGDDDQQYRSSKRFQGSDRKWRQDSHDISKSRQNERNAQSSTPDLRHKLQKRVGRGTQSIKGGAGGIKDLREKLSGTMQHSHTHSPAVSMAQHQASPVVRATSSAITAAPMSKRPAPAAKPAAPVVKPAAPAAKSVLTPTGKPVAPAVKPSSASKVSTGTQGMTIATFLQSLDLSKYLITFQAEEIDMPILRVMKEEELKELGIPMGPRKKITLALAAQKS